MSLQKAEVNQQSGGGTLHLTVLVLLGENFIPLLKNKRKSYICQGELSQEIIWRFRYKVLFLQRAVAEKSATARKNVGSPANPESIPFNMRVIG